MVVIREHWPLGMHTIRTGFPYNRKCCSCLKDDNVETVKHFLCDRPGLTAIRHRVMEKDWVQIAYRLLTVLSADQNGLTTKRNSSYGK